MIVYKHQNELYHHGVKGQKWGVRRYQNPDGTLTPLGKKKKQQFLDYAEKRNRQGQQTYQNAIQRARNMQNRRLEEQFGTYKVLHKHATDRLMKNLEKASYEEIKSLGKTRRGRYEKALDQAARETWYD